MAQTEEMDKKIQRITAIIKELHELGVSKNRLQQVVQYLDGLIDDNRELTEADYQTWGRI